MFGRCLLLVAMTGLWACGTSGSRAPATAPAGAPTEASAPEDTEAGIEVTTIPHVPPAAVVEDRSGKICRNEKRTGSHRVTRVCRTRTEIEREETEGKKLFDDLHESQQEY